MKITLPYDQFEAFEVPDNNLIGIYDCPEAPAAGTPEDVIAAALQAPIGCVSLHELARGKRRVLIVSDDVARPTPVALMIPALLAELHAAGVPDDGIAFMMALGSHRFMTRAEMIRKLGRAVVDRYPVHNHDWKDPAACEYMGATPQGAAVWINRKVKEADLVIGLGRIMPIDVCGFTGGGKILVPGVCGRISNSDMHWTRMFVPDEEVIGKRDNPIRQAIDAMACQAGLKFIVNVIMDRRQRVVGAVAGDPVAAHRRGCELARPLHAVSIPRRADIVVVDGFPFDIEFWQVNKALDTAGLVMRDGGITIVVSPCYEGFCPTHPEILKFGYRSRAEIVALVEQGHIEDKVVGVHMMQVSKVAIERGAVILVTTGISPAEVKKVGFSYARQPAGALAEAFRRLGKDARVIVLRNAAQMLPHIIS